MGKKILLVLVISFLVMMGRYWFVAQKREVPQTISFMEKILPQEEPRVPFEGVVSKSLFVPYWYIPSSGDVVREYDELIYFGVAPESDGTLKTDEGYDGVKVFAARKYGDTKTLLAVRMLNDESNENILENGEAQEKLISQVRILSQEYEFDGVVLDLEVSALPFSGTQTQITEFVSAFAKDIHSTGGTFGMTAYGDQYYRRRPYDIKALGQVVDRIYIMAYDFHKSRGEPGPNFPYVSDAQDKSYPYSFQQMIKHFSSDVSPEKLTVLFGMYGYDWTLGPQGKPLKAATAISLREIEEGIVPVCKINTPSSHVIPDLDRESRDGAQDHHISLETLFSLLSGTPSVHFAHGSRIVRKQISSLKSVIGLSKWMSALVYEIRAAENFSECSLAENKYSQEKMITYVDSEGYAHVLWYEDEESVETKIDFLKTQGIGAVGYWVWGYW